MIWPTVIKIMALAGLSLLMETSIASAQIFQRTDVKGVIHFTDNPYSIPESIRNSSALIVRKDLDTKSHSAVTTFDALRAAEVSSTTNSLDADPKPIATTVVTYAPQEVIVVVNPNSGQPSVHPCNFGSNCKPAFRPDFTDRRYIHPSVFEGGSRRYVRR
ncbi:MAG TPA: hypothetical protein VFW91_06150 [Candidatus Binatia bacterium]|nr:hypothetical protein [Candidatus Binatia bacterium]